MICRRGDDCGGGNAMLGHPYLSCRNRRGQDQRAGPDARLPDRESGAAEHSAGRSRQRHLRGSCFFLAMTGATFGGACSIGERPTVEGAGYAPLKPFCSTFNEDIYGQQHGTSVSSSDCGPKNESSIRWTRWSCRWHGTWSRRRKFWHRTKHNLPDARTGKIPVALFVRHDNRHWAFDIARRSH